MGLTGSPRAWSVRDGTGLDRCVQVGPPRKRLHAFSGPSTSVGRGSDETPAGSRGRKTPTPHVERPRRRLTSGPEDSEGPESLAFSGGRDRILIHQ